jgi:hypothetical protein
MLRLLYGALALMILAAACGDDSNGGTGATGGEGGTGGAPIVEPGPTCIAFCAHIVGDCDLDQFTFTEASCRQGCQTNLDQEYASSESCGLSVEAVFECATDLDCEGVADWADRVPPDDYPCRPEVEAVGNACPSST